jgi:GAF domain-containing protein
MLKAIRDFFRPPFFEGDEDKTREAYLLFLVLQTCWAVPLVVLLVTALLPAYAAFFMPFGIGMAIIIVVMMIAARRGHIRPASITFIAALLIFVAYTDFIGAGVVRPANVLFAAAIVIAGLLLGSRGAVLVAVALIIEHGLIVWAASQGAIHAVSPLPTPGTNFVVTSIAYVMIALFFGLSANSLKFAIARVRNSERELSRSNRDLQDLSKSLEARVAERTRDLERRAKQLKIAAEVGSAAAALHDVKTLFSQVVRLISLRFDYYHTGIFLLDEAGEYAVLQAASSEGGQRMLARRHKLQVGREGIVGTVAKSGQARLASQVGLDAVYFQNPDLPDTRSEMALPLVAGGQILGVLDVQSTEEAAFNQEDLDTLQVVVDQLAIAIENARLIDESAAALEAARRAYGEVGVHAWRRRFETGTGIGFRSSGRGIAVQVGGEEWSPDSGRAVQETRPIVGEDGFTLSLPILIRGQAIGALRLVKASQGGWAENEIQIAQLLSDQLSSALDSARLYDEAQRRAGREQAIAEVSSRIGSGVDIDHILRSTAEELSKLIGESEVVIQLAGN